MKRLEKGVPPRRVGVGDVVAAQIEGREEWTVAQIVRIDAAEKTVAVLELDWSGPEPSNVAELGEVAPLVLTHHSWSGRLSFRNCPWVLPRSHKVIGALPLLHDEDSSSYGPWDLGFQLVRQRRWERGEPGDEPQTWILELTGEEARELFERDGAPRPEIRDLRIGDIDVLDCAELARRFPGLTRLRLSGCLGLLSGAAHLRSLTRLRRLNIDDLHGMTADDRLLPQDVPELESLDLYSVPADYAKAMREIWRPEIPAGVDVSVLRLRKPGWVEENRDNPLRDWDGREEIPSRVYKKAIAQCRATREAVLAACAEGSTDTLKARLEEIGGAFAEAFNRIDEHAGFLCTLEREELFEVLDGIVTEAGTRHGPHVTAALDALVTGADEVRDW